MNQRVDVSVTKRIGLKFAGIVRMAWHMVGAYRHAELRIPQNAHDLQKIHFSFVGVHLREIVETPADVAHMHLMYLPSLGKVLDDRQNVFAWILQAFRGRSKA